MEGLLTTFENLLKNDRKLRFLAPDPNGKNFQAVSDYFRVSKASEVEDRLNRIYRRLKPIGKENIEIRTVDLVFPTGYFMMDPKHPKGKMVVQEYLYGIAPDKAPLFELTKENDKEWFDTFLEQFEFAWDNKAEEYSPTV